MPIFAVLWGGLFLGETLTVPIASACAVIFLGTALATGVLRPRSRAGARAAAGAGDS